MAKSYIVEITEKMQHPNADKLEFCKALGFWCITRKDQFEVGDLAIYFETDAVLPDVLIEKIFSGAKVKPHNGRIRAMKIRGSFSEGLLADWKFLLGDKLSYVENGQDLDALLGVQKYEPPVDNIPFWKNVERKKYNREYTASIPRYIDTVRLEKAAGAFDDEDEVHVTSKIHGSSSRFGLGAVLANTTWAKVKLFFRKLFGFSGAEFVCGTRNVDIGTPKLYHDCAKKFDLEKKIPNGYVLYGEICGHGIQKDYDYGFKPGEFGFFAYALKKDGKYVDYDEFINFCKEKDIPTVPLLARGKWKDVKEHLNDYLDFDMCPTDLETYKIPCREGVVIGTVVEGSSPITGERKIVKYINPEYLIKDNSDFH